MQEYVNWFLDNEFLKCSFKSISVCEFLFNRKRYQHHIENSFNFFINKYVYQAHKSGFIPVDIILETIGIMDLYEYMHSHFIEKVSEDYSLMLKDISYLLATVICEEAEKNRINNCKE